jgi:hypothetical protein
LGCTSCQWDCSLTQFSELRRWNPFPYLLFPWTSKHFSSNGLNFIRESSSTTTGRSITTHVNIFRPYDCCTAAAKHSFVNNSSPRRSHMRFHALIVLCSANNDVRSEYVTYRYDVTMYIKTEPNSIPNSITFDESLRKDFALPTNHRA